MFQGCHVYSQIEKIANVIHTVNENMYLIFASVMHPILFSDEHTFQEKKRCIVGLNDS